jgi:hypothetical protein
MTKLIDFVVGYECGFIIRCQYTSDIEVHPISKKMQLSNEKVTVIGKFNRNSDYE